MKCYINKCNAFHTNNGRCFMKYNGKIKHPKDLVTKEFVEDYVNDKFNEASIDKKKSQTKDEIVYEVIDDNLYLGGRNGR